jgi:FtsH-binding integral membrane protein
MKEKTLSILIFIILVIAAVCLRFVFTQFEENHEWTASVLTVPLAFFLIRIFSKSPSEKPLKTIAVLIFATIVSLLLRFDFSFCLFTKQALSALLGAVLTFYVNKLISSKMKK